MLPPPSPAWGRREGPADEGEAEPGRDRLEEAPVSEELIARALELAQKVIGPLVLGGPMRPVRPLGPRLALEIGLVERIADDELQSQVEQARLRRARAIVAVDALPDLGLTQWAMAAALNDLLQVTNDQLGGLGRRGRHRRLLKATTGLCAAIPPPAHLGDAVARHATFARLLEATRTDRHVSWWTESRTFRGRPAPSRLLVWPRLRRVRVEEKTVELVRMADDVPVEAEDFAKAVAALLACSPLTDLGSIDRAHPPFAWSRATLAVAATVAGSDLALRAFARQQPSTAQWLRRCQGRGQAALHALQRSMGALARGSSAHHVAARFARRLYEALQLWSERTQQ